MNSNSLQSFRKSINKHQFFNNRSNQHFLGIRKLLVNLINTYDSLGFINSPDVNISYKDLKFSFEEVFNNLNTNKSDIVSVIKKYVPDFEHIETGKHLDQKM